MSKQNQTPDQKSAQKPTMTLSDGALKAAIWRRENDKGGSFYAVSFSKTYRDDQGNYQSASNFTGTDLLKLSVLAKDAYQASRDLYYQDRQSERAENQNARENRQQNTRQNFGRER